jgi:hypothetical protein
MRDETIGRSYAATRREDPRIAGRIHDSLGDARSVVLGSFWAHPERVLDERARANTSGFARMPADVVERVVRSLRRDLEDGSWDARHGELRALAEHDVGLRLIVARRSLR